MTYQMPEPLDTVIAFFRGEREFLTPDDEYFATTQMQAAYAAGVAAGLEAAAKVCDTYAEDKWALYKGRAPYSGTEEGRASPDTQGHSDGASDCADAIRNLAKETPCA